MYYPERPEEGIESPRPGIMGMVSHPVCGWESNPGPLGEELVLLTGVISPAPHWIV